MKCVFFGSPDFAVGSLQALLSSSHKVVGVITQPDRPAGRGMHLEPPPVKKLALTENLPVLQPEKVNGEDTYEFLQKLQPDILVVVAYGEFLGGKLLQFCSFPPVNVHPSRLPDLRGAAPAQWAVLRGYKETAVSTQFMVKEMDAGDILLQESVSIGANETAGQLLDRCKAIGGALLVKTLDGLEAKSLQPIPQDSAKATFAPLLEKEMGNIPWAEKTAEEVHHLTCGLSPWPGAYSFVGGKRVKILETRLLPIPGVSGEPGSFFCKDNFLFVKCKEGAIAVKSLQPEGKKAVLPVDFANGMRNLGISHFDGKVDKP